jgi:D-glycero-alpha-D-manno-heptose 1-phosphate guanylyltransferase
LQIFNKTSPDISGITCVILAGGRGSRLSSVVSDRPKVLAEVHGRPFLTYLLDQLISAGAKQVVLCTGYMADEIEKQIGAVYKSLKINYSREDKPLGTAGAIRNVLLQYTCSEVLIVMNGDSFVEVDFKAYLRWYFEKDRKAALLLTYVMDTKRYGLVNVADDDAVVSFVEKGENAGEGFVNAGVYIVHKDMLTLIPLHTFYSLEQDLLPALIGSDVYGYRCRGKFIDIGTPESYRLAEEFI